MKTRILAAMLVLSGCSDLPRDPEGTMERVRDTKVLRAGVIATGNRAPDPTLDRFIQLVANDLQSTPRIVEGSIETLLPMVEKGALDIVVGRLAPDTPWSKRVTILPAPQEMEVEEGQPARAAVVRNGENAWVAFIQGHAPVLKEKSR